MRFLVSVVAVILVALLIGGGYYYFWLPRYGEPNFQSSVVGNPYPDKAERGFYGTCRSAQEVCDCMWAYMEENYSYDEYLQDREEGLTRLNEAAASCAEQYEDAS